MVIAANERFPRFRHLSSKGQHANVEIKCWKSPSPKEVYNSDDNDNNKTTTTSSLAVWSVDRRLAAIDVFYEWHSHFFFFLFLSFLLPTPAPLSVNNIPQPTQSLSLSAILGKQPFYTPTRHGNDSGAPTYPFIHIYKSVPPNCPTCLLHVIPKSAVCQFHTRTKQKLPSGTHTGPMHDNLLLP